MGDEDENEIGIKAIPTPQRVYLKHAIGFAIELCRHSRSFKDRSMLLIERSTMIHQRCRSLLHHFLVTQCAWCGTQMGFAYSGTRLEDNVSHGICRDCSADIGQEIDDVETLI
ncbi:MAG TPA: hypothetical protein VNN73_14685 [Blastocatellia bacterium]|nr:hypothetical protein [Blastocatellia bacterium]